MPENEMPIEECIKSSPSSISSGSLEHENLSLSSLSNHGDDGYNRGPAVYQPVILPKETTLDELLRNVVNSNDLNTLPEVHLRISSNMLGLHRLNVFLPNLMALNLDGSELASLRDLGTNLNVKYLNVSRCGLRSLDGTNGLTTVQHLVADGNHISNIQQVCNLTDLKILSLRGNKIEELALVSFLVLCSELKELDLSNNPVARRIEYRDYIKSNIPQLILLDGQSIDRDSSNQNSESQIISSSEYSASSNLSSEASDGQQNVMSSNDMPDEIVIPKRPASSSDAWNNIGNLPSSSLRTSIDDEPVRSVSSLGTGDPISGNIVLKARRERRKKVRTAWADSNTHSRSSTPSICSSTNSSSSTTSSTSESKKSFPRVLPQLNVELELGIVGLPNSQLNAPNTTNDVTTTLSDRNARQLLAAARQWRQKTRAENFD